MRTDLAVRSLRSAAPIVVLDDAALAYLAARGARLMDATMRVLLPFANVNRTSARSADWSPPRCSMGATTSAARCSTPDGTQIIYGGGARTRSWGECVKTTTVDTAERGRSPLGAHIRFLKDGPHGNMIHSTVPSGMVGRACHFRSIDEYWYVLG